eukprot:4865662-Karenia_brevis.AAC.1
MDPTSQELSGMKLLVDALEWVGISNVTAETGPSHYFRDAWFAALGNPSLPRHVAAIPKESYDKAMQTMKVPVKTPGESGITEASRELTPMEEGQ